VIEPLNIEITNKTPEIRLDAEKGLILIKGKSIPENASKFYKSLIEWIVEYSLNPKESTTVDIMLEYLNTDTHKYLLEIFKKLEPIQNSGNNIIINWYYEEDDEEMMETGEEYEDLTSLSFKYIPVSV